MGENEFLFLMMIGLFALAFNAECSFQRAMKKHREGESND